MERETFRYVYHNRMGRYFGKMNNDYTIQGIIDKNHDDVKHNKDIVEFLTKMENMIVELDNWMTENEIVFPDFFVIRLDYEYMGKDCLKVVFDSKTKRTSYSVKSEYERLFYQQFRNRSDFPLDILSNGIFTLKEVQ